MSSPSVTITVTSVEALCEMLVQGWNVVNPKSSLYDVQVTIESMQSVKILLKNKGGGGDNLNVYIANGKTYVSKSTTPDETVTLYGVWLPDNYDATNESGMQKPFELLSPDVNVAVDFSNVVDAIAEKPNPVTVEQLQNKTQEITRSLTNINNGITLLPKQNDIASMTTQVSNLLTTGVFNAKIDETNAKITELQTTFVELKQSIEAGNKVLSAQFDNSFKKVGKTIANSMAIMSASVASFLSKELQAAQEAERQAKIVSDNASEQTSNAQIKLDEATTQKAQLEAKAKREAEEQRRREAQDRARREEAEAQRKAKEAEAQRKAKEAEAQREAQDRARREEAEAQRKAQEQAQRNAEEQAKREAEEQRRREAEEAERHGAEEEQARREAEEQNIKDRVNNLPNSVEQATTWKDILTRQQQQTDELVFYTQQVATYIFLEQNNNADDIRVALQMQGQHVLPWFRGFIFFKALDLGNVEEQIDILKDSWFDALNSNVLNLEAFRYASRELKECMTQQDYFFDDLRTSEWHLTLKSMRKTPNATNTILYQKCYVLQELIKWCDTVISHNPTYQEYATDKEQIETFITNFETLQNTFPTFCEQILDKNAHVTSLVVQIYTLKETNKDENVDDPIGIAIAFVTVHKIRWFVAYVLRWHCKSVYDKREWLAEVVDTINDYIQNVDENMKEFKKNIEARLRRIDPVLRQITQKQIMLSEFNESDERYATLSKQINQDIETVNNILFPVQSEE